MRRVWGAYRQHAWGHDELKPISLEGDDNWGGIGCTLVDSLDTLWLMGLRDEFWEARDWVRDHLSFSHTGTVSVFETTIRELGGLLSAYDLSGDKVFLSKAKDLGERLLGAFDTPSGVPMGQTNLQTKHSSNAGWTGGASILAELGE
jgi:mannosyl-oligosaccharide alpha-1,2-mannosidase